MNLLVELFWRLIRRNRLEVYVGSWRHLLYFQNITNPFLFSNHWAEGEYCLPLLELGEDLLPCPMGRDILIKTVALKHPRVCIQYSFMLVPVRTNSPSARKALFLTFRLALDELDLPTKNCQLASSYGRDSLHKPALCLWIMHHLSERGLSQKLLHFWELARAESIWIMYTLWTQELWSEDIGNHPE